MHLINPYKKIMTFAFVILEPKAKNLVVHHASRMELDGSFLTMTNVRSVTYKGGH